MSFRKSILKHLVTSLLTERITKKYLTLSLFLALFFLAPAVTTRAQETAKPAAQATGTWESIGTLKASRMGDHDEIMMPDPHQNYTKLKFKVTDAPVNIKKIVVNYEGGESQTITNRYEVKKGSESNIIDLKAGDHKLKSVEVWYDTQGIVKGKAHVTLMGMK